MKVSAKLLMFLTLPFTGKMLKGRTLSTEDCHFYSVYCMLDLTLTNAGRSGIVSNATVDEFREVKQEKNKFVFTVSSSLHNLAALNKVEKKKKNTEKKRKISEF